MLEAKSLPELQDARPKSLDAPTWKDNPALPKPTTGAQPQLQIAARLSPQQLEEQRKKEEEARRGKRETDKVLGGRMVWNVLHLLRGEDLTDVQRKDALNQLVVAAVLILVFVGVVVGVLVAM